MIKITAIKLPESFDSYKNTDGEKAEFLEPVSKINIFVGSNNSGKSRFMRMVSQFQQYEVKQQNVNLKELNIKLLQHISNISNSFDLIPVQKFGKTSRDNLNLMRGNLNNLLTLGNDKYDSLRAHFEDLSNLNMKIAETKDGGRYSNDNPKLVNERKIIMNEAQEAVDILKKIPIQTKENAPQKIYIPTLRGLRPLDVNHTDLYAQRTNQDYFEEQESPPEVFTGLSLYQRLIDLLLGNNSQRNLIQRYQNFISDTLYEGKPISLIPKPHEKIIVVKIGNEKEQPIHHLGDGIQSTIILTFLPFVMQEQTFFFIEEPEMYLHPGLQRKILEFYNSLEQHKFFMTTHSNHFLDITIDIKDVSIFTFRKILGESGEEELTPDFTIEAVDSGCESSLELLGVRNSSVFLVNATIWVEGITDRWYLRKMLESYMDFRGGMRLEEDTHYSFVEYGGANITHWSFLDYEEKPIEVQRLCAKAVVIIDKDGEKKEKRKDDLLAILGERLIILPCREVENLLSYKVIKEVVSEYEKKDESEIKDFDYEKYQNEYLGKFIEDKMLKKSFSRKGGYKAESGTLRDKVKFCEKALPNIQYTDLPDSTKEIIQNIYQFIYNENINK
jgi:predicted ATP-dependent endonuclease of OLD family